MRTRVSDICRLRAARGAVAALCMLGAARHAAAQAKPPAPGQIHVATTPDAAVVSLNGVVQGTSPLTVEDVRPGTHLLTVSKNGFREARRTLEVAPGQRLPVDLALEPLLGLVLIHSEPPGASVEIAGADRGKTPLLLTDLPFGDYRVTLTAPGYLRKELELHVKNRTPVKLDARLDADSAVLAIESVPPGAAVRVNGISRGTAPCRVARVPQGATTLEVALDGYEPYRQEMRLAAGQEEELTIRLRPLPARLTVETMPPGARIYVGNQFRGVSPLTLNELEPGSYRIRAEKESHEPLARTVTLERADDTVEEFRLVANVGALEITTEPAGVTVFVDGKPSGETPAPSGQTDRVSQPLNVARLEPGTREVRLTRPGYRPETVSVEIQRDRTTTRHVRLQRRFIPNCEVRTDTRVYRGVLMEVDPLGNVKIEVRPGVMKTISAEDVRSRRPLRLENTGTE